MTQGRAFASPPNPRRLETPSRCPTGRDAYRLGEMGLSELSPLALLGQPEAALTGHQSVAAPLSLLCTAYPLDVGGAIPAQPTYPVIAWRQRTRRPWRPPGPG